MLWVTTDRLELDAAASAWLIRRFLDREACFRFCPPPDLSRVAAEEGGLPIGAPGEPAGFPALVRTHLPDDVALGRLAQVIRCASDSGPKNPAPEAAGLRAVGRGFPLVARGDEIVRRSAFLYDALYALFQVEPPVESRAAREARALAWFWLR
jgi:hypothetical protein